MSPHSRQRLFRFLVPLLACVLSLIAIELGLAIFYPVPFSIATNMYFEADPRTGWRIRPNSTGFYQLGIPGNGNSRGNRDVEVSLKKPPGVFRILALGNSFTVGTNVRQEEAWPKVLERQLRSAYGPNIEVVNTGTGAWDPFQYAQYFEHFGYRFEPDLIVIGFFVGNDTYEPSTRVEDLHTAVDGQIVTREAAASPTIRQTIFLYNHSHLARLLINRGPAPGSFHPKQCDDFSEHYLAIAKSLLPSQLRYSAERREKARNALATSQNARERRLSFLLSSRRKPGQQAATGSPRQSERKFQIRLRMPRNRC